MNCFRLTLWKRLILVAAVDTDTPIKKVDSYSLPLARPLSGRNLILWQEIIALQRATRRRKIYFSDIDKIVLRILSLHHRQNEGYWQPCSNSINCDYLKCSKRLRESFSLNIPAGKCSIISCNILRNRLLEFGSPAWWVGGFDSRTSKLPDHWALFTRTQRFFVFKQYWLVF